MSDQVFLPSKSGSLQKIRIAFWVGFLAPVVIGQLASTASLGGAIGWLIPVLIIMLPIDWFFRRQAKLGREPVTIGDDGIASAQFSGPVKRLAWQDVESVALDSVQGTNRLKFQLRPSSEGNRRSFRTGARPSRPVLSLYFFEPAVQEQMLEAINRRVHPAVASGERATRLSGNEIAEQRVFEDQLKNLASTPWVTYSLIAVNLAIWLMAQMHGAALMRTPADMLLAWGGNAASEVQEGEWWRLLSATFLHGGLIHVAVNMLGLYGAGMTVERIYGHKQFALIYLAAGLSGSALSLHFSAQHAVSVGASGAVFGVFGALLVATFSHRDKLPKAFSKQTLTSIGFFVVYSLLQGFGKQGIDNAAHVGGLIGGALIAFILPVRLDQEHFRRVRQHRMTIAIMVACAMTAGLAWTAPRAEIDQSRVFASNKLIEQTIRRFDSATRALVKEAGDIQAGTISEIEADERSRSVHAPVFRRIADELSQVVMRPEDPREPLVKDTLRMSELFAESLGMQSVIDPESGKITPVDPARAAAIEAELIVVSGRLKGHLEALKAMNPKSGGNRR